MSRRLDDSESTRERMAHMPHDEGVRRALNCDLEIKAEIKLAVEAEREACAGIAEEKGRNWRKSDSPMLQMKEDVAVEIAAAIRARGKA